MKVHQTVLYIFAFISFFLNIGNDASAKEFGISLDEASALIENRGLRVRFEKKTGHIQSLVDKEANQELWDTKAKEPLFRLTLTQPASAKTIMVSSDNFNRVEFHPLQNGQITSLSIRFSHCAKAEVEATSLFSIDKESQFISARLQIRNQSTWAIKSALFPSLTLTRQIGDGGEDDRLLFPGSGGELFKNPGALRMRVGADYPGWASYQMLAYYDNKAGLYLATYDVRGEIKLFWADSRSGSLNITPMHIRPEIIGGDFEDAYPVVLAPIRGPWYNAADLYKTWAKEQFWCKKTLAQRDDLPDWLKSGPSMFLADAKLGQVGAMNYQDNLNIFLNNLEHYRKTAGTRHLILATMGWEHQGPWLGPNYFPSKPSDAWWKELSAKGKERGLHTTFMTNGYKFTVKRRAFDFGKGFESGPEVDNTREWQKYQSLLITEPNGQPMYNDKNYETGGWIGAYSKICRGSSEGRQIITNIFTHLAKEMGASSASFDQEIGGGESYPCYNPDHGHPPGFGKWMSEEYRKNLSDIIQSTKKFVKDFFLYQEGEGELTIPYQGTSWARNYHIYGHPHPNAWGVPVYPYLYHEYITGIGGALHFGLGQFINVGKGIHPIEEKTRAYATARNLAFGQLQGDRAAEILLNRKGEPESLVSRAYFSFCQPLSDHAEFLVLGKMKRPFPLQCKKTEINLYTSPYPPFGNRIASDLMVASLPSVLQGVFESPQGKLGVILVNATDELQEAEIHFLENNVAAQTVHEYRKGKEVAIRQIKPDLGLKVHFDRLEPVFLALE